MQQTMTNLSEFNKVLDKLIAFYPDVKFISGKIFSYNPEKRSINYPAKVNNVKKSIYALLHEVGHYACNHVSYDHDLDLLEKELEAWRKARQIASELDINISDKYVDNCLNSYRDWLHQRSQCQLCSNPAAIKSYSDNKFLKHCLICNQSELVEIYSLCKNTP